MIGPSARRVSSSAHTTDYRRRQFFKTALGGVLTTLSGCAAHDRSLSHCPAAVSDFELSEALGPLPVYRCKSGSGPPVVLLHELAGMSPEDIALAKCLAQEGLSVYVPLLFGEPGQNRYFAGYSQSYAQADFECSALSTSSPIIGKLRDVCRRVSEHARGPVGVIGMCLTGAFPVGVARRGSPGSSALPTDVAFQRFVHASHRRAETGVGLSVAGSRSRRQKPDRRPGDALPE